MPVSKTLPGLVMGAAAALAGLGWYSWQIETRRLRIVTRTLPVPDLPAAFEGYRIAHLSDLHMGIPMVERTLPTVITMTNDQHADLIAITGDFVTGERDGIHSVEPLLEGLHAPDGVWGVLGNHDYHHEVSELAAVLQRTGIGVLRNEHHVIRRGADRLVLAGVDDLIWGRPDFQATLAGAPDHSPVILMAHEPDFARLAAADPRIVLQLSGHTHGGQIRLPRRGAMVLPALGQLYSAGGYQVRGLALYVNSGVGTGQFAVRFNCRPEIAVITLVRGTFEPDGIHWKPERSLNHKKDGKSYEHYS